MAATVTKIAEEAGVSVGLVSRLLRGDPTLRISPQRREIILRVRDSLGGLKTRETRRRVSTRTILAPINRQFSSAWINANITNTQVTRNLEAALARQDFHLHFGFFENSRRHEYYRSILENGRVCDGLLILSGASDHRVADLLHRHEVAHVSSDYHAEQFRINTVRAHTSDGLRQAVEHLRQLGHERIGYLGHAKSYRYPLVVAALSAGGLAVDAERHCFTPELEPGQDENAQRMLAHQTMARFLKSGNNTTALIASNDRFALGAIDAMHEAGLTPGQEISLVGHDNLEERGSDEVAEPIITTVDNPYDLIGRRMGELLLNQIEHRQKQVVHERIPVELIIRRTTGPAQ